MKRNQILSLLPILAFAMMYFIPNYFHKEWAVFNLRQAWAFAAAVSVGIAFFASCKAKARISLSLFVSLAIGSILFLSACLVESILITLVLGTAAVAVINMFCYSYSDDIRAFYYSTMLTSFLAVDIFVIRQEYALSLLPTLILLIIFLAPMVWMSLREMKAIEEIGQYYDNMAVGEKEGECILKLRQTAAVIGTIENSFFIVSISVLFLLLSIIFWPAASKITGSEAISRSFFSILCLYALLLLAGYIMYIRLKKNMDRTVEKGVRSTLSNLKQP